MTRYIAYLNNYDIRPCTAQYLWWFYYLMDHMPETCFLLNNDYLSVDKNRWEYAKYQTAPYKYSDPSKLTPKNFHILNKFENQPELANVEIPSHILNVATHKPIPSLVNEIVDVLNKPENKDITAGICWVNNASFDEACNKIGIPVIHNESGALRTPRFIDTCYFDFSGVNGNTEFTKRFKLFKEVSNKVKIYGREELLELVSQPSYRSYIKELANKVPEYECGVALQVDVDTNVLAFNRDVTESDVLNISAKRYNKSLLVRNHPLSSLGYTKPASLGLGQIDDSKNSLEFISKCKRIYTLNSSVAFEALLMGRKVRIFGDNPFRDLQYMNEEELILALNFAIFSYLMPTSRLYNEEYYNMRIQCKEEEYLYNEGQRYWLNG
jgi:hypothetical protein